MVIAQFKRARVNIDCVFRTIVTARSGIVTDDFGIVTGRSGNVTDWSVEGVTGCV